MSEPQPDRNDIPEAVVEEERRGLPVIWLLPLVALLAGGWILFKTLSEQGPEVVIQFRTAAGIEEGKTRVKYRDVTIGEVIRVRFADDLSHVLVHARLVPGMESHLTDTTRFWVVRPRIGTGGVSGLETLVSGAYVAMDPGEGGKSTRRFGGLEKPPVITTDLQGTRFSLEADRLGNLAVGSLVYFRQIVVGEVTEYALAEDHDQVNIGIFVRAPHDRYVRGNTRFWHAGGVDLSLDASGVKLEMSSFMTLLTGGVAFETPRGLDDSTPAPEDTVFHLYATYEESQERTITKRYPYVVQFSDTVRGLTVGAPVEFRGIRVGTVTDIAARVDIDAGEILIPVLIEMEPERFLAQEQLAGLNDTELGRCNRRNIERLVERGMRARLQTGNLLTGQLFVELDIFPEARPAEVVYGDGYPRLPTVPRPLAGITASVNRLLDRLEDAPLEEVLGNLDELLRSTTQLMRSLDREAPGLAGDLRRTNEEARAVLREASDTLQSVKGMTTGDGEVGNTLMRALDEMRDAARAIRLMAEYLERHPEALLQGKGREQ